MKLPVLEVQAASESAALPPLYGTWIRDCLPGPIPAETNARCDHCAMCDASAAPNGSVEWYNPHAKCCTYLPQLPNFNVGRILLDSDPVMVQNRATVEARIAGPTASPLGVRVPPSYTLVYETYRNRFGHDETMRCPHYLAATDQCGIWRHRNAVCSTYFCKHVRGAVGQSFWHALRQLLQAVEGQLEFWCVEQLWPGEEAICALMTFRRSAGVSNGATADDGPPMLPKDSPNYKAIWGRWAGKEHEFYNRCAGLVAKLAWADVLAISGQEVRLFAAALNTAYRALCSTEIPDALRVGPMGVVRASAESVRLTGYSSTDDIEIPRELFDALSRFDGRPTAAALRAIEDEHGLELTADLIRGLVDFQVLQ